MLGIKTLYPPRSITYHQVRIKRMHIGMDKQCRSSLLLLMELPHPLQVDVKQDITENKEE